MGAHYVEISERCASFRSLIKRFSSLSLSPNVGQAIVNAIVPSGRPHRHTAIAFWQHPVFTSSNPKMSVPLDIIAVMDEHVAQQKRIAAERKAVQDFLAAEQLEHIRQWQAGMDPVWFAEKPLPTEKPLPPNPLMLKVKESNSKKAIRKVKKLLSSKQGKASESRFVQEQLNESTFQIQELQVEEESDSELVSVYTMLKEDAAILQANVKAVRENRGLTALPTLPLSPTKNGEGQGWDTKEENRLK